jgi:PQQ-dependent catabolism-associated beta-propeller protein
MMMSDWVMLMKQPYGAVPPLTLRSPLKAGVSKGEARRGPHGSRRACGAPHHEDLAPRPVLHIDHEQRAHGAGPERERGDEGSPGFRHPHCPRPEEPAGGGRLEGRPRLRKHIGIAACLLTAALALAHASPAAAYIAFVSNEKGNTVSVIDTDTWTVTKTIKVGQRPRGIAFTRDGKFVMVAVGDDDTIQVIDAKKMEIVDTLPSGPDPELFAQDAQGKTLYVANENDNTVTVLDLEKRVRIGDVQVGVEPEGMMLSPDGKILICTSETTNMAHFIDTATRKIVANVLVDARPRYAEFKTDGSELWVSAEIGGTVSIIDPAKREVTGKIKFAVPGLRSEAIQPVGIALTKDGKTGFVALGPANRVAVVDGTTHEVKKYLLVGQRVWHMEFTPDEKYLLVTNGVSNDVSVIDVAAQKVIKTIQVGELPWGITIAQP